MSTLSPLFSYANDGSKFYKAVMTRLAKISPHVSLNAFCDKAGIVFSTTHRWRHGSKPDGDTVMKVEKAFRHFERRMSKRVVQGGISSLQDVL